MGSRSATERPTRSTCKGAEASLRHRQDTRGSAPEAREGGVRQRQWARFRCRGLTLREYLDRRLKESVRGTVRQSTYEQYEYAARPHTQPALGRIKLKSLTPIHVRGFYREKLNSGLSPATVYKLHVVLRKALNRAVSDGLLPRKAAEGIKVSQTGRKEIRPLTLEQTRDLLGVAR